MLCVSEMAEALSADSLAQMLTADKSSPSDVIIIDCRPLLMMNSSRIQGAHGVHCPPIVKRRSGGNIPLDCILRNPQNRESFLTGSSSCIVVYDDRTHDISDLPKDSNMYLVIKTLREERPNIKNLCFLQGGFKSFQKTCPDLCSMTCDSPAVSLDVPTITMDVTPETSTPDLLTHHPLLRERADSYSRRNKEGPREVLPWLYIGNLHHAMQTDDLLKVGMTTLINMAAATETTPVRSPHFCYKNIPIRDSCSADMLQWFPEVIECIEETRKNNGKVLVHCQAGISRSATACIAYLMYYKGFDLEQAFDFLHNKRTVISPNLNFMRQLTEFQTQLRDGTAPVKRRASVARSPKLKLNLLVDNNSGSSVSSLGLSLTPCTHHAFAFDSPFASAPIPTTSCSPSIPLHSPLMSPS